MRGSDSVGVSIVRALMQTVFVSIGTNINAEANASCQRIPKLSL